VRVAAWLSLLLVLSGPAAADSVERPDLEQQEIDEHMGLLRAAALEELRAKQSRITEIHYRLQVGAARHCRDELAPVLGAAIGRRRDFLRGHESEAEEAFGAGDEVRVFVVAPGSPAERAGLKEGDLILSLDDLPIEKTQQVYSALRASRRGEPRLRISRDDTTSTIVLPREEGCHHGIIAIAWPNCDTFAHRNREEMYVPTGLVRFSQSDDELALGIAHQMAHHVLGSTLHIDPGNEPPADRLSLYMVAAAGFDFERAADFWDRLAAYEPAKILFDAGSGMRGRRLHVGMPARAVAIRETIAEIREKVANEEPLVP
jgi:hypothetical protein